jgi:hypothetical protein
MERHATFVDCQLSNWYMKLIQFLSKTCTDFLLTYIIWYQNLYIYKNQHCVLLAQDYMHTLTEKNKELRYN